MVGDMDAGKVIELTGLTYGQLNYLIKKVDVLKRKKTQGKARDFTFREVVFLKLASLMRSDGIRLDDIDAAIKQADEAWINDNPQDAGVLVRLKGESKSFSNDYFAEVWKVLSESPNAPSEMKESRNRTTVIVWSEDKWLIKDDDPEFSKYANYLPRTIYSVSAIAEELAKGDQLELMLEEMAVE